ncbi:TPA: hypothetical protein ACTYYU_001309 [Enterobacter hormaechei]
MKQKFIEWFTKNNNGCSPAMEDDRSFVYEMTQNMFEAYQAGMVESERKVEQLAAENAYLLKCAARELNTSWMFHKTMLGAQAALVCLTHGYQAAAREWLEGTTDEAGAEIPDDISVGELPEWFDSQMVSNDGKSGFLTRSEAEEAIKAQTPATDAILADVRASSVEALVLRRKTAARIARDRDDLRAADALEGEASRAQMFADEIRQEAK